MMLMPTTVCAQLNLDTLNLDNLNFARRNKFLNRIFQDALNGMKRAPTDTSDPKKVLFAKSDQAYKEYEGKIVRHIHVRAFRFERNFTDTTNRVAYFGTRLLNRLHIDTKEWVIKNNIFIDENKPLNAFELADNERYLRTLEFIQDARIVVQPIPGDNDSVDLMVVTKDLFTLKAVVDISGVQDARIRLSESNLLGMGQKAQVTGYWQQNRYPAAGYEVLYSKNNLGGVFVNGTIAYTTINTGSSDGGEEEQAFFLRLDRPLVTPFSHLAGGAEVSFNQSMNVYRKPDSVYYHYRYNNYDIWGGYNLGTGSYEEAKNYTDNRNRTFVSLRYAYKDYVDTPAQIEGKFDPTYNDRQMVLGQVTFFRQDFYKLNYIYGFGTTEDIPSGYSVSLAAGWHQQNGLDRPYAGLNADVFMVMPRGGFLRSSFRLGGFYKNGAMQDAGALMSLSFFTRIIRLNEAFTREYIKFSYTQLNNRVTTSPLYINNPLGLRDFNPDSTFGDHRISAYIESVLYTPYKLFGFRLAPFIYAQGAILAGTDVPLAKADIYTGFGGGLRARNENLIFGTIELRAIAFPVAPSGVRQFRINLVSDLRYRYQTRFINAPDVIQLNSDYYD